MLLWPFNKYPGTDYETFNWAWLIDNMKKVLADNSRINEYLKDAVEKIELLTSNAEDYADRAETAATEALSRIPNKTTMLTSAGANMYPYADIEYTGGYQVPQGLHKYGEYFIAINAYTGDTPANNSAQGVNIKVLDETFQVLQDMTETDCGHGNSSAIIGNKLYLCGDAHDYESVITVFDVPDLLNGTVTKTAYTTDITPYSIAASGGYLYASTGTRIYKLDPADLTTSEFMYTLPYTTQQDLIIINEVIYSAYWDSVYNRNWVMAFNLFNGELVKIFLMPFNMGTEFDELESICNNGTDDNPDILMYFNSHTSSGSNYILRCQFISAYTVSIAGWLTDPKLPIPFDNRDNIIYYKPSHHGLISGTNAATPANSSNILQWFLNSDRYNYIELLENVSELSLINAKKQLTIQGAGYSVGDLNLYYCDIVDMQIPITGTLTMYRVNMFDSLSTVANVIASYCRMIRAVTWANVDYLYQIDNVEGTVTGAFTPVTQSNWNISHCEPILRNGTLWIKMDMTQSAGNYAGSYVKIGNTIFKPFDRCYVQVPQAKIRIAENGDIEVFNTMGSGNSSTVDTNISVPVYRLLDYT